jgi:DNA end-binding protein Ku
MRSIWTGAISFGLVYIPVKLYNATVTQELDLDLLRKSDMCPIHYAKVCRASNERSWS